MYYLSIDPYLADQSIILPCPHLFMYVENFKISSKAIINPGVFRAQVDIGVIWFQQFPGSMKRRIFVKIQIPLIQPDYIQTLLSDPFSPIIHLRSHYSSFPLKAAQTPLVKMSYIVRPLAYF